MAAHIAAHGRIRYRARARHVEADRRRAPRPTRRRAGGLGAAAFIAILAAIVALLVVSAALPCLLSQTRPAPTATTSLLVGENDTLWTIAAGRRLPGMSTTEMVSAIRDLNDLTTSDLAAGTVLRVPVVEDTDAHFAGEMPYTP